MAKHRTPRDRQYPRDETQWAIRTPDIDQVVRRDGERKPSKTPSAASVGSEAILQDTSGSTGFRDGDAHDGKCRVEVSTA